MLFNSFRFAAFFPAVVVLYTLCPRRWRWLLLLIASYLFYMAWEPGYVVLLWLSTIADYCAAFLVARQPAGLRRRAGLVISLAVNLGLLFFFKYYNFFSGSLHELLALAGWTVRLPGSEFLLPVGISFYTFQTLGYTIDVYRGTREPERHFGRFALYVAFFPQLVAGPIERASRLLPQFETLEAPRYENLRAGLQLMLWGMIKKVVMADRFAQIVDYVYADPRQHPGPALAIASLFFAFQIYCDFSGYTDIAIGAARVFGIRLMNNFDRPYFAENIRDFWRRWHISLSTWFRDYLYVPLGGNRVSARRWTVNIAIVFLLCGLWHGAAWKFAVWGGWHAALIIAGRITRPARQHLLKRCGLPEKHFIVKGYRILFTFFLVSIGWIFFRAADLGDACYILTHLNSGWSAVFDPAFFGGPVTALGVWPREWWLSILLILFLLIVQTIQTRGQLRRRISESPVWIRWAVYSAGLWMLFLFGMLRQQEFIYFEF
jgi:alginate O-acetyltransferase complex protein AlgI